MHSRLSWSRATSSGIDMSGVASTHRISEAIWGASLPPPAGRPCRAGGRRTRLGYPLHQLHGATRTHAKISCRSPTRLTRQHLRRNPIPKIARIGFSHDPPPNTVNHKFHLLEIPRFVIQARCSSVEIAPKTDALHNGRKPALLLPAAISDSRPRPLCAGSGVGERRSAFRRPGRVSGQSQTSPIVAIQSLTN